MFGFVNFCRTVLLQQHVRVKAEDALYKKNSRISTSEHEIGHVLGFSTGSFHLFRDAKGNARTPAKSQTWSCGGASTSTSGKSHYTRNVPIQCSDSYVYTLRNDKLHLPW